MASIAGGAYTGVAKNAKLHLIEFYPRVLDNRGYLLDAIRSLQEVLDHSKLHNTRGRAVVNMSFGECQSVRRHLALHFCNRSMTDLPRLSENRNLQITHEGKPHEKSGGCLQTLS